MTLEEYETMIQKNLAMTTMDLITQPIDQFISAGVGQIGDGEGN
jgi:hypothetical protein